MEAFKIQFFITTAFFIIVWLGFNKPWWQAFAIATALVCILAFGLKVYLDIRNITKTTINITNNHYHIKPEDH